LKRTDHATYCPYKGDCNYYSVPAGGKKSVNVVWTYEDPYPAVAQIREHVAFYPDRVDEITEQLPTSANRQGAVAVNERKGNNYESDDTGENKALVLDAFDTLFNKRDYAAAEKYGRLTTSNTARTSNRVAMDCSI